MIYRQHHDGLLVDWEAARLLTREDGFPLRSKKVIRDHCQPVACDVQSRAVLYDCEQATKTLLSLSRRKRA